jgi:hypothetical protein
MALRTGEMRIHLGSSTVGLQFLFSLRELEVLNQWMHGQDAFTFAVGTVAGRDGILLRPFALFFVEGWGEFHLVADGAAVLENC